MKRLLIPVLASIGLAGCYTTGDVGVSYSGGYTTAYVAPELYYVSPGVSVVAYSDYPVFYADNYYWRYDNGIWYSSPYYNSGWSVSYNVPYGVRGISRPYSYARFRPSAGWRRAPAPAYRGGDYRYGNRGPAVRDHRTYSSPGRTYSAPRSAPQTRDHRTYSPPPSATRSAPRSAPQTRDHRTSSPPASAPPARSAPTVRDHRRH